VCKRGPWDGNFVFDKLDDARTKTKTDRVFAPGKKRVTAMPWLGFCVTETFAAGRVALLVCVLLLLLLSAHDFASSFQRYLCTMST